MGIMDEPVNGYKSIPTTRVIHDYYESDPTRGFIGGGGIDARAPATPLWLAGRVSGWGQGYMERLADRFTHGVAFVSHATAMQVWTNSVSLDPKVKDKFGRPAIRVTFKDHPNDLALKEWFRAKTLELMEATGAKNIVSAKVDAEDSQVHLLGTCRMGNDPKTSVVDKFHRTHDIKNLFLCDGSSLVTSSRGQPTMTIQALAFRAAEHLIASAKRGDI
jgi:choline dehydrogenase-like flavoprotein